MQETQTAAAEAEAEMKTAADLQGKMQAMLKLQDQMNRKVHPDWIAQRFEWYRAAWIECAELMDHLGYKWWKKQVADEDQVRLEIIDIWHFCLSACFDQDAESEAGWQRLCQRVGDEVAEVHAQNQLEAAGFAASAWGESQRQAIREATESLAEACLAQSSVPIAAFWRLLVSAGIDFDQLYSAYIGKNVLNFFRQDHGYKDGSYRKLWQGREDNEHLSEIVASLDCQRADFQDAVYAELATRYQRATDEA